jgi:hypothetical protein
MAREGKEGFFFEESGKIGGKKKCVVDAQRERGCVCINLLCLLRAFSLVQIKIQCSTLNARSRKSAYG